MDSDRRRELRRSLENLLETETTARALDARGGVGWLDQQLDEYVNRWLGFCAMPSLSMLALVQSDLFAAVEIGASLMDEQLTNSSPSLDTQSAWSAFLSAMNQVRTLKNGSAPSRLKDALDAFRSTLKSSS